MVERQVQIVNRLGLHARAAAKLVHMAASFGCDVSLIHNGDAVDAKSILGILQLGACQGTEIAVACDGRDEAQAVQAITELIENRFGEDS